MKLIYNHPRTFQLLDTWTNKRKLVMARFFFWSSGTSIQRSLKGLLRGLLHSILKECPDIIPVLFPTQWDETEIYTNSSHQLQFSYNDIRSGFEAMLKQPEIYTRHRFVFFIDGLDEFEPEGDLSTHIQIVDLLKKWTGLQPQDIKICVSSREWPVFDQGFAGHPRVRLQELTWRDMLLLADDSFVSSRCFQQLNPDANTRTVLSGYLMDESDGVFIWLVLVLRRLEEGLQNRGTIDELRSKVKVTS
jgi:hypothetical protein